MSNSNIDAILLKARVNTIDLPDAKQAIQQELLKARIAGKKEVLDYMIQFTQGGKTIDWDFIDGYYSTDPDLQAKLKEK
jgi:hypothetical protein